MPIASRPRGAVRRWLRLTAVLAVLLGLPLMALLALGPNERGNGRGRIPEGFVHDGGSHKVLVPAGHPKAQKRLEEVGGLERSLEYGGYRLLTVNGRGLGVMGEKDLEGAVLRDDMDLVAVNRWTIDTRVGEPGDIPADRMDPPGLHDRQLYVVQFVGPVKDEWLADVTREGDAAVVAYLPSNAYVVRASRGAWKRLSSEAGRPHGAIQWVGVYHPAYRISPELEPAVAGGRGSVDVVVQLVEHPGAAGVARDLKAQADAVLMEDVALAGLRDVRVRVPAASLPGLADLPDVFWIEPALTPRLFDERQGQIMASNLDASGSQPSAPGYLAWLAGKGFGATFPFTVDIADDGLDRGSTTDVHGDFRDSGGTSRITYVLNYTGIRRATAAGGTATSTWPSWAGSTTLRGIRRSRTLPGISTGSASRRTRAWAARSSSTTRAGSRPAPIRPSSRGRGTTARASAATRGG